MTSEQSAFALFEFQLGQRVQHKVDEIEGIVVRRILVQAANGNTGRCYTVCWAPATYTESLLELELEAVEDDDDEPC